MMQDAEASEQAEALVNTLQLDGANLNDANLATLSSSDLEQLANLQAELDSINAAELETEIGEEVIIETEELEQCDTPDEILPDIEEQIPVEPLLRNESKEAAPPPLRPLTIAPKPVKMSQMALKTAVVNQGQQIVLIQSPGGQQIKLVAAQGQPVLQNLQLTKQIQVRTVPKTSLNTTETTTTTVTQQQSQQQQQQPLKGAIKKIIPQNKNLVTKMIVGQIGEQTGNHGQQIKLVSSSAMGTTLPANAKTITLAQAQQMGLITGGKVQQIVPQSANKQTVIVNKQLATTTKTIKVVPQIKSPTKILPAPMQAQKVAKPGLQRVIIKQGGQLKGVSTSTANTTNQVIRLPAGQTLTSATAAGQIHQINVPGKGVQYIRFMPTSSVQSSTTVTTPTITATQNKLQKAQVVPVAGISISRPGGGATSSPSVASTASIKVVPISTNQTRPVAPKPIQTQRVLIPAQANQPKQLTTIPASALSQILPGGNNVSQIVMLPAQYVQQISQQPAQPQPVKPSQSPQQQSQKEQQSPVNIKKELESTTPSTGTDLLSSSPPEFNRTLEPNGIRPRKPCNCTKSLCLKLYCDCFANGEFCHLCNCMNCYNNLEHEEERSRAIRNCLERNPNAFRPKIGKGKDSSESTIRKHTKGCNCKRSGCLKNYCECYEAKIACSSNCKCIGCRNIEDSMEKKNVRSVVSTHTPDSNNLMQVVPQQTKKVVPQSEVMFRPLITNTSNKSPSSYMTTDVIEATTQCLIARAEEAERSMYSDDVATRMILEEFGRCLVEIINCAKNASNNQTNTNT